MEIHNLSIISNTAVPSPSSITLDHDTIKPGELVTAAISFTKGDRPDGDELLIDWGDATITILPMLGLFVLITTIYHRYQEEREEEEEYYIRGGQM